VQRGPVQHWYHIVAPSRPVEHRQSITGSIVLRYISCNSDAVVDNVLLGPFAHVSCDVQSSESDFPLLLAKSPTPSDDVFMSTAHWSPNISVDRRYKHRLVSKKRTRLLKEAYKEQGNVAKLPANTTSISSYFLSLFILTLTSGPQGSQHDPDCISIQDAAGQAPCCYDCKHVHGNSCRC
jgi:hypothetical protein